MTPTEQLLQKMRVILSDLHGFHNNCDARELAKLIEIVEVYSKSQSFAISMIEKLNEELHGDLYGCDCESGGCDCKPALWLKLEEIKYHLLGTECAADEIAGKGDEYD